MTITRRSQAALLALLVGAGHASAQVDPSIGWRTLHTAHFRIHFRPAYRDVAREAAREAERAYGLLATELHPPRGIVDLTLADDVDAANGFTSTFPSNRIVVLLAPPAADPALQRYDSWLRLVIVHELTHVFHLDRARGIWGLLQRGFGRAPGLFPNEYQPSWVVEGLATYYESRFTGGGRVKGSFHTQVLAADGAARASRAPRDALFFTRWPDGLTPYAYGSRFFDHLTRTTGDSTVPRFIEATAKQLIPYRVGRQLRRVGVSEPLTARWREATQPPPGADGGAAEARVLDARLWTAPVPEVSPDGRRVAYVHDDGKGARRLRVVDAHDFRVLRSHRVNGLVSYDWLGDTLAVSQLDYTDRWHVRSDLYAWNPAPPRGRWRRVTHGARLTEPHGVWSIAITPADNRPAARGISVPDRPGTTWGAVVPSPDGRWVAAARHVDGQWALVRWAAATPESVAVLVQPPGGGVVTDPAWGRGGEAGSGSLLYVADFTGLPQVYRWTESGEPVQITADPLGARDPAELPDGTLLYTTLGAHGWELRRASPPLLAIPTRGAHRPAAFDSAPPVPTRESAYAVWPSLRPHFWVPAYVDAGPAGLFVGGVTAGTDAIGRFAYVAEGLFAWDPRRAQGAFGMLSHAFGSPTLDFAAWNDWVWEFTRSGHVVSGEHRNLAGGASVVLRRWRSFASLRVAAEYEGLRFVPVPDTTITDLCPGCGPEDLVGGSAILTLGYATSAPLAVSPQNGFTWNLLYRRRDEQASPRWSNELRSRLALYVRLPGTVTFGYPVLGVRLAAGMTTGPLADRFSVGGVSSGVFATLFGQTLGSTRSFPVRGYAAGELRGTRATTAAVELRVPLALVGRSLGALPFGADKLSLSVFGEAGGAWDPGAAPRPARIYSAGLELVGDVTVNYDFPIRVRLGVAQPLARPSTSSAARRTVAYAAFGADF